MADSAVHAGERRPLPGLLVVFSRGKPLYHPVVLRPGEPMTVGREFIGGLSLADEKMSTLHAELSWEAGFTVKDLGSRNGTSLDGVRIEGAVKGIERGVLKLGQTLLLLVPDVTRFTTGEMSLTGGVVVGPTTRAVLTRVALARGEGAHLLVRGETGAGKELVAKAFHEAAPRAGPLVSFNCANLQPGLAEARLFGTVKGAFNEARDSAGLFLQADGGVLFLDEIAELDMQVQAKLLRAIETGEVQRVGESSVRKVNVVVVAASHQSLQSRVKAGQFRQDLMFRLNQFEVHLPALKERPEEIPWLMQRALLGRVETLHVSVVEAALLRPWPGNVRQLLGATGAAAANASLEGGVVKVTHLAPGVGLDDAEGETGAEPEPELAASSRRKVEEVTEEEVVAALAECDGNATHAAKRLGLYRTQLSRLRQKFGLMKKKD